MKYVLVLLGLSLAASVALAEEYRGRAIVEGGALFQTVSDVEIPPGTGTRFSLVDAVGKGPLPYARLEAQYALGKKHRLRMLIAPLVIEKTGSLDKDVVYNGKTFAANVDTTYRYQFNSYRLSYTYRWFESSQWAWDAGVTAKIRQAEIALTQGSTHSSFPDLGFVPLLRLAGEWNMSPQWQMLLDLDAIGSPYGRAIDLGLFAQYKLSQKWQVGGGYRTVEGGADVDPVYNFAWLHYFGLRGQMAF